MTANRSALERTKYNSAFRMKPPPIILGKKDDILPQCILKSAQSPLENENTRRIQKSNQILLNKIMDTQLQPDKIMFDRFRNEMKKRSSTRPEDVLNVSLNDYKFDKEINKLEQKNWRKQPTMRVTDMARNPTKAKFENVYIAERKFKYHLEGGLTYSQIRENLSATYGGFT